MHRYMEKRTLLLVTDAWHPQVNGVVTYYVNLVPRLEATGVSVTVVHPGLFWTIPTPTYPEIRLSLFPRRTIRRLLAEVRPTYVHIATEGPLGCVARSVCIKKRIPFTTTYSSNFDEYVAMRVPIFRALIRDITGSLLYRFHRYSARVMISTRTLQKKLEGWGIRDSVIAPLAVDVSLFRPIDHIAAQTEDVFAYIGRIAPEKNIEEFLLCDVPGKKLVVGDGPSRSALERRFPDAMFVGVKKGEELVRVLSSARVTVFPSRMDTFGLVILESLACGVPVAAHPVMGPQDIITDGADGFLRENLREAIDGCLSLDRGVCRKKAEQYSWDRAVHAFASNLVSIS